MKDLYLSLYGFTKILINTDHTDEVLTLNLHIFLNWIRTVFPFLALTSYCNEVMEVHSSAIIRILVISHNQGLLINHLSLNSNYPTVFLEWFRYGAKLPTKDIV